MHPIDIPSLFPGASAALQSLQHSLIEDSNSLAQRWNSIVGEISDLDLLRILEIETSIRERLLSYLAQLDEEVSQALNAAYHRIQTLRHALKQPHGSDLITEHERAAEDLRFMINLAKDNVSTAEEIKLEIIDLQRRIQHLAYLQARS